MGCNTITFIDGPRVGEEMDLSDDVLARCLGGFPLELAERLTYDICLVKDDLKPMHYDVIKIQYRHVGGMKFKLVTV